MENHRHLSALTDLYTVAIEATAAGTDAAWEAERSDVVLDDLADFLNVADDSTALRAAIVAAIAQLAAALDAEILTAS